MIPQELLIWHILGWQNYQISTMLSQKRIKSNFVLYLQMKVKQQKCYPEWYVMQRSNSVTRI